MKELQNLNMSETREWGAFSRFSIIYLGQWPLIEKHFVVGVIKLYPTADFNLPFYEVQTCKWVSTATISIALRLGIKFRSYLKRSAISSGDMGEFRDDGRVNQKKSEETRTPGGLCRQRMVCVQSDSWDYQYYDLYRPKRTRLGIRSGLARVEGRRLLGEKTMKGMNSVFGVEFRGQWGTLTWVF